MRSVMRRRSAPAMRGRRRARAAAPGTAARRVGRRRRRRCRRRTRPRRPRAASPMVSSSMPPSTSIRSSRWPALMCRRAVAHLVQQLRHERLAAEAGLDRHDQERVEVRQDLQVRLDRRIPVDGQPGLRAGRAQVSRERDRIVGGLDVERHVVRAGLRVTDRPPLRRLDHQVAVERQSTSPCAGSAPPAGRSSGSARSGCPSRRRAASPRRRRPRSPPRPGGRSRRRAGSAR